MSLTRHHAVNSASPHSELDGAHSITDEKDRGLREYLFSNTEKEGMSDFGIYL